MTADESAVSPVIFNEEVEYWLLSLLVEMRVSDEGVDSAQSGTTPGLNLYIFTSRTCRYLFLFV